MYKRPQFSEGGIYHIYNRGVEKRNVFTKVADYLRFIKSLYEFNDKSSATIQSRSKMKDRGPTSIFSGVEREPLVDILVFCLMPNHYHLLLRQLAENGISLFMQKLGSGYTGYFNLKYDRVGSLFQGRYKAKQINNNKHFQIIIPYIHLNTMEITNSDWRERGIRNWQKTQDILKRYKWSSHLDYIGQKNFPNLVNSDFLAEVYDSVSDYQKALKEFNQIKLESVNHLIFD